jgi:hypothetical protein
MSIQDTKQEAHDLCEEMGLSLTAIDTAGANLDDALSSGASFDSGQVYQLFHVITGKLKADQARLEQLLDAIL